ncbi:DUF6879 family protein [Streptomyces flavidovirens]|uniref:DUF6879 family protein n=1 Tax=Streptomyces flavidovirens TaxID=67298 RepID=A0ABW6R884_9ACTN
MDVVPAHQILDFFREGFEHTAWRLETRRAYAADEGTEEYGRFLEGVDPRRDVDWPWFANAREQTATGRRIERVRLVDEPGRGTSSCSGPSCEWLGRVSTAHNRP